VAAAKAADKLLTVDGVMASFAVCKIENSVFISARSTGTVNVQVILEKLGGGGHFDAAATQLKDISINEALSMLKEAIDEYADNTL
jgi:c-di-AMP phosphodiesterase-like protein